MPVKKQHLEPDMEQNTGSKLGKEYVTVVYYHPAYLTYMQRTSCKMLGWMKSQAGINTAARNNKKEKTKPRRLLGEISITSDMHVIPL